MSGRHILHVDANSFYSSVEMQENPTLRGKRIAVCGSKEDRHGIVLTASYPAKRMGVKTGMAIWRRKNAAATSSSCRHTTASICGTAAICGRFCRTTPTRSKRLAWTNLGRM